MIWDHVGEKKRKNGRKKTRDFHNTSGNKQNYSNLSCFIDTLNERSIPFWTFNFLFDFCRFMINDDNKNISLNNFQLCNVFMDAGVVFHKLLPW